MKKFDKNTKVQLKEELEHSIFEMEERMSREVSYKNILEYKEFLVGNLLTSADSLEEIDQWEFEHQILISQIKQSDQDLLFLREDLGKYKRIYEIVKRDLC